MLLVSAIFRPIQCQLARGEQVQRKSEISAVTFVNSLPIHLLHAFYELLRGLLHIRCHRILVYILCVFVNEQQTYFDRYFEARLSASVYSCLLEED